MAKTRKRGKGPIGHGSSSSIAAEATEMHRRKRGLTPLSDREHGLVDTWPEDVVPAKSKKPGFVKRQRCASPPRHQSRK